MSRADIERIIRRVVGDFRFERVYPGTVEGGGDAFVDVRPDDDAIRGLGLQRVPLRVGAPATVVRVELGTRCLLAFADGDPRQPYVCAWEYRKASAVLRLDGGDAAVARHGDLVDVLVSEAAPVSGIMTGTLTVPGTPPVVTPIPPGTPFSGTAVVSGPMRAVILGGAPRVRA